MIENLIRNRRSVFPPQYNGTPIRRETLERILQAANWAPTHKRTEPWRFYVMQGKKKEALGRFLQEKYRESDPQPKEFKARKLLNNPLQSGAVIAICMQRDPQERLPEWEEVAATAMAVQNMWLVCTALGIGCYWSSPGLIRHMDAFLPMSEGERCLGFLYMGYYDGDAPEGTRTPWQEKVTWLEDQPE